MSWYNTPLKYMTEAQRVEAAAFLEQLKKGCGDMDEFEPLAGVEAPNDGLVDC